MTTFVSRIGQTLVLACGVAALYASASWANDSATIYKSKCAMCHGADGKGSSIGQKMGVHDFASADVQKQSDAQLTETITKGKNKMPSYEGKLKDTEIKDLVAYIRTLAK